MGGRGSVLGVSLVRAAEHLLCAVPPAPAPGALPRDSAPAGCGVTAGCLPALGEAPTEFSPLTWKSVAPQCTDEETEAAEGADSPETTRPVRG